MPEELKKEEPMIDVGETEGAEIDLEKDNSAPEQKEELQVEETTDSGEDTKQETEETKEEAPQKEELEQYSEGVKKRIAKLISTHAGMLNPSNFKLKVFLDNNFP